MYFTQKWDIILHVDKKYALTYPAPDPTHRHFYPLREIASISKKVPLFDMIFGHPIMREQFKKISGHGTLPVIIGAAVAATGHSQMFVRSIAVMLCAIWFALDIGIWVSGAKWQRQYKAIVFCLLSCLFPCGAMGIMYWFLLSTLEDQQTDVAANISIQPFMPSGHDVLKTGITVKNGGGTDIQDHTILCRARRIVMYPGGGMDNVMMMTTLANKSSLAARGDGETSYCLAGIQIGGWPTCADMTIVVSYSLVTQPVITNRKRLRFVAQGKDFEWHQQPVDYPGDYCPALK